MAELRNGMDLTVVIHHLEILRFGAAHAGELQPFIHTVEEGVAADAGADEKDLGAPFEQPPPRRPLGCGRERFFMAGGEFRGVPSERGQGMGRMQTADHARTLAEQLRQDADAGRRFADIEDGLSGIDFVVSDGREHQQPLVAEIIHQHVEHGIGAAFHGSDGFHGRVYEQGVRGFDPEFFQIFFQLVFGDHGHYILF